jgi:hypothetical protein
MGELDLPRAGEGPYLVGVVSRQKVQASHSLSRPLLVAVLCVNLLGGCEKPEIVGIVKNGVTGEPVPEVNIAISGTTYRATTARDGKYSITFVPGQFQVTAQSRGFYPARLELNIAQAVRVPAQDLILYPELDGKGIFEVSGGTIRRLPTREISSIGNLLTSYSGLKEVCDAPGIDRHTRLFRAPADGEPLRMVRLGYVHDQVVQSPIGAQRPLLDMWMEQDAIDVRVSNVIPDVLQEVVLPADLPDGVYAFGSATAASTPIDAALASKVMAPFVFGDPDRKATALDLQTQSRSNENPDWDLNDPEKYATIDRLNMAPIPDGVLEIQSTMQLAGVRLRVRRASDGKILLGPLLQDSCATIYGIAERAEFVLVHDLHIGGHIIDSPPYHLQLQVYHWEKALGQFVAGEPYTTVRRYGWDPNHGYRFEKEARGKVYFLTGHGEPSPDDKKNQPGMGLFADILRNQDFDVATIVADESSAIPDDAVALIVGTGDRDHSASGLDKVKEYMKKGGSVLILLEPRKDDPLVKFTRELGVRVGDDVLIDQETRLFQGVTLSTDVVVSQYSEHPTAKFLAGGSKFSLVRSVSSVAESPGRLVNFTPLAFSATTSWAETELGRVLDKGEAELEDSDTKGPVSIAAAGEASAKLIGGDASKKFKVAVFGDTSFLTNQYLHQGYNDNFGQSAVSWLAGVQNPSHNCRFVSSQSRGASK